MNKPNKEQIEAYINNYQYAAATVAFADLHGFPASELAAFVELIVEKERESAFNKQKDEEYAYKTIQEYEQIAGFKTNEVFRIGWDMARAKMKWFK